MFGLFEFEVIIAQIIKGNFIKLKSLKLSIKLDTTFHVYSKNALVFR